MIKKVVLTLNAQQNITQEIGKKPKVETGGVLCGYYKNDEIFITEASGPGPDAIHEIDEFIMDKTFMYTFLDQVYAASLGQSIYIGEWHTHPQTYPIASDQDYQSIAERSFEWTSGEIMFLITGFVGFKQERLKVQSIALSFDKKEGCFWKLPLELNHS